MDVTTEARRSSGVLVTVSCVFKDQVISIIIFIWILSTWFLIKWHKYVLTYVSLERYIATNFPKTMALTDGNGRTALHYAATVNDSGDIYRTLEELGSMTTKEDKVGKAWIIKRTVVVKKHTTWFFRINYYIVAFWLHIFNGSLTIIHSERYVIARRLTRF